MQLFSSLYTKTPISRFMRFLIVSQPNQSVVHDDLYHHILSWLLFWQPYFEGFGVCSSGTHHIAPDNVAVSEIRLN